MQALALSEVSGNLKHLASSPLEVLKETPFAASTLIPLVDTLLPMTLSNYYAS